MPIRIECEECGKKYQFPDKFAGRIVPCKECDADIEVYDEDDDFEDEYEDDHREALAVHAVEAEFTRILTESVSPSLV